MENIKVIIDERAEHFVLERVFLIGTVLKMQQGATELEANQSC